MKLIEIEYDPGTTLTNLIKTKQEPDKSLLARRKQEIICAQTNYKNAAINDSLEMITKLKVNNDEKSALINCYKIRTITRKNIIEAIWNRQKQIYKSICPYCGVRTPETNEHYLLQDEFPEFSLFPLNIFPCCTICNSKKDKYWKENGRRLYLNKYFDDDEIDEYLLCNTAISNNTIVFHFRLDDKKLESIPKGDIIKTHYEKLDLLSLYKEKINEIITSRIQTFKSAASALGSNFTVSTLRSAWQKEYEKEVQIKGRNSYTSVAFKGIYTDANNLNFIYNEIQ